MSTELNELFERNRQWAADTETREPGFFSRLFSSKDDKKQAADAAAAEKRDAATEKRARSTTALVTAGSEVLKRLEQLGPNELLRLKIFFHMLWIRGAGQGKHPDLHGKPEDDLRETGL